MPNLLWVYGCIKSQTERFVASVVWFLFAVVILQKPKLVWCVQFYWTRGKWLHQALHCPSYSTLVGNYVGLFGSIGIEHYFWFKKKRYSIHVVLITKSVESCHVLHTWRSWINCIYPITLTGECKHCGASVREQCSGLANKRFISALHDHKVCHSPCVSQPSL